MDASAFSSSLVGVLVPFLTQAIRHHLLKWNDKAANFLALVIAAISVSLAYFFQNTPHSWTGWLANFSTAYTLSQVIYRQIGSKVLSGPGDPGNGSGSSTFPPPPTLVPAPAGTPVAEAPTGYVPALPFVPRQDSTAP